MVREVRKVWYVADHCVTPIGTGSSENFDSVFDGRSALTIVPEMFGTLSPVASVIDLLSTESGITRFESISLLALQAFCERHKIVGGKTLFILSTTKGNIELLANTASRHSRLSLHAVASYLADKIGLKHSLVVSNACISGVLALIIAKRMIERGTYDHAIVLGAEALSPFIVKGFQSLHALSNEPCKPFDKDRQGINLGEAAGVILLSATPEKFDMTSQIEVTGCGTSNDANHISGPSRTGEGLAAAISAALQNADVTPGDIDAICAHGTATIYNDEMEAKAFRSIDLQRVPVYSLKGTYGHTLGAAGVLETIIARHSLQMDVVPGTRGFATPGTSPINVNPASKSLEQKRILKTASGFGGCNAALILEKIKMIN